jgi:hypothetical protein
MRLVFLAAILVGSISRSGAAQQSVPAPAAADPFAAPTDNSRAPLPAVPAAGPSAKQTTEKPVPARPKASRPHDAKSAEARIEQELNAPTDMDFVEMPLKDVIVYLTERHNIPIVLKMSKLQEAGVSADKPITKSLRSIRLRSALNIILEDIGLAFAIKDEVLQITSPDDAQAATVIRIYDCRDLLTMPTPGNERPSAGETKTSGGFAGGGAHTTEAEQRAKRLMSIITTNVDPLTWQENAGPGSIGEYNGLLVVSQTPATQEKIRDLLEMLRRAAGLEANRAIAVKR